MVRVLQIGLSDNKGGIESFVMNYYRHLNRAEVQYDFINNYNNIAYSDEIRALGGRVIDVPDFHIFPLRYYIRLKSVMREYDIVHIHMLSLANILPILAAKKAKVKKVIVHAHSTRALGSKRQILDSINKRIIKRMRLTRLACSEAAGKWMYSGKSFEVLNNAIETEKFEYNDKTRFEIRQKLGINEKAFVIGNVAALMEEKNHIYLLSIFSKVLEINQNSFLIIVGDGYLMDELKKKAENTGISKRVLFLGSRDDVNKYYNVFDCFVLPSLFEGTPFTLIEAQTNGLNCYVSKNRVSIDNDLLGNMRFIELEEEETTWAESIIKSKNTRTMNSKALVELRGFDISSQIAKLMMVYIGTENE